MGRVVTTLERAKFLLGGLFFFLLPTQLAYFFWPDWAYLFGIKVDFLSPVIFLTDIIALLLAVLWLAELAVENLGRSKNKLKRGILDQVWGDLSWPVLATIGFLLINVFLAYQPLLAVYRLAKWGELVFLLVYFKKGENHGLLPVDEADINKSLAEGECTERNREPRAMPVGICFRRNFSPVFLLPFFFSLLLVSFLSWGQLFAQESLQGFFWCLGERFFNTNSLGVARMDLFNRLFIRPLATFSHPNSLAGFILVSAAVLWKFKGFLRQRLGLVFYLGLIIILTVLVITFSAAVWLTIVVAGPLFLAKKLWGWRFFLVMVLGLAALAYLVNYFGLVERQSVLERWFLARNAWRLFLERPVFGWGLGNFVLAQGNLFLSRGGFNFYQPVHNLYLLVLAETGFSGLVIFSFWLKRLWKNLDSYWRIVILLIIISGFFDHYWLTLQQNFLLLGVIPAVALSTSS
jgi:hypothetical protein